VNLAETFTLHLLHFSSISSPFLAFTSSRYDTFSLIDLGQA